MLERLACERAALILSQVFPSGKTLAYPTIVGGINDDDDMWEILGSAANHRGPTNVDVLQRIYEGGVGTVHGVNKWVEVGCDYINCADTVLRKLCVVLCDVAPREYAAVDSRVQRLHTTVQNLREAGQVFDVLHRNAGIGDGGLSATGADERVSAVVQGAGEICESSLVVHA